MLKQNIIAVVAVFILWQVTNIIIHGVLLGSTYEAYRHLWRPEADINMTLAFLVTLIYGICFVAIYQYFISEKSLQRAVAFGAVLGVAAGVSMGIGTFIYMPVPLGLAVSWLLGTIVEHTLAGVVVGLIIKTRDKT